MMSDHRFGQIKAQLSLYDAMDPDHIDLGVAREAFADCRRLLREFVDGAQLVGRGQEDAAPAVANDGDHTSCLETIGKQAETIAAQADQIVSLSKTTTELTLAVLKK